MTKVRGTELLEMCVLGLTRQYTDNPCELVDLFGT